MKPKKLQRKIERATIKIAAWEARLHTLQQRAGLYKPNVYPSVPPADFDPYKYPRYSGSAPNTPAVRPEELPALSPELRHQFRNGYRYAGLMTKVAASLGITLATVKSAARGHSRGRAALIALDALYREMRKRDEDPVYFDKASGPFGEELMRQFQPGGRYWGLMSQVARAHKTSPNRISQIALGHRTNPVWLETLKSEMARIDAEIAAKGASNG